MRFHPLLTACAALLGLCPTLATAQTSAVPNFISYQGRVVDAAGANVGAGTPVNRTVIFRIWDSASSTNTANLIYSESQTVTVSEGEFSVLVGQGVANPTQTFGYSESGKFLADLGTAFNGSARYLGVTVAAAATIALTDNEITPRQQIVSTAFAMRAKFAESIGSSSDLALTPLSGTASNYGLGWYGTGRLFGGTAVDGPVLYGNAGGALGSNVSGTQNTALRWDSSGRVGIGTTTPTVALDVTGAIKASGAVTGGSFATSLGNVGIGTLTPTARLDIVDGTTAGTYGSVQISRPANGHTGSHLAFVRAGGQVMGMGYGQSSPTFGLGGVGPQNVFTPNILSIDSISNVGIGTASPGYKLDVRGNGRFTDTLTTDAPIVMGPGSQIYGSAVAGVSKPVFWPRAADDATYLNIGSNGWYVRDDADNVVMRLTSAGRLGVGTSTPANHLQVQAPVSAQVTTNAVAAGNAVAAIGASDAGLHFGTYNNTNGYGSWIQSMRTWDNYSFNLVLNPNGGNVGIGTSLPGYPLSVAPKVNVAYTQAAITHNNNNFTPQLGNADGYTAGGAVGMNGQTWQTSIYAEGVVAGSAFVATSDLRIKDIVNRSSTRSDLALINQLQVTDYRLKDSIGNGKSIRKGFIAQEVRKIIPEAVSPSPNFIPDIYVLATQSVYDAAQKHLSVTLAKPHALVVGEWVRIYGDDNTMETKVLTVESANSFTVASEKPMAKAFVYGRRVDDFLTVDYDRLFTTGIGAIQELDRQLKEKDAKIAALEAKVAEQDKRSTAQADEVTSQNARLVALEKMMSKAGAPETVSIKLGDQ